LHSKAWRLTVNRTNLHIYASVISGDGSKVLASASTAEADVRKSLGGSGKGGNAAAAQSLASALPKRRRLPASRRLHLTVQALPTTAASRLWPMQPAKPVCSSDGIQKWLKFKLKRKVKVPEDGLARKMIAVNRVTKVVKGGRILGFAALTVVGDGDGRVGMGKGKSKEVPAAVQKAMEEARRNMVKVSLKNGTIHHNVTATTARQCDDGAGPQGYRHHRWWPYARRVRSVGHHRHRGQEPWLVQPLQHGSRHV
jgi:hypothetical protein